VESQLLATDIDLETIENGRHQIPAEDYEKIMA
jgi:hypothetical protein